MKEDKIFESYPDLMTISDVQALFQISRSKAYDIIRSGKLRHLRIGRLIRIPKPYILDFLSNQCYNISETVGKPSVVKEAYG